jgi:DNA-binding response OmpR family regulator
MGNMREKPSILVVEDEDKIRLALGDFLEFHNFQVTRVSDGAEADNQVRQGRFDLILLDLMLPVVSGEQLCEKWRQSGLTTPIIMVTAKGQPHEKIAGLNLGADDYLAKPFSLEELLARIQAVLRRTQPDRIVGKNFSFGPWQVDMAQLLLLRPDQPDGLNRPDGPVPITQRQAQIMQYFATHSHHIISREELYAALWGEDMSDLGTRTVDMHIAKLRQMIELDTEHPQIIKTVRGSGYKYNPEK